PAVVIEGARGATSIPKTANASIRRVWAGEERPSGEVIRCLFDMAVEDMIDAIVFDSRRSYEAARAFMKDLHRDDEERVAGFPTYIADGERVVPAPFGNDRETASEELTV